jgi:dTDP-4-dehydrorhamnose 3,5-epimerase
MITLNYNGINFIIDLDTSIQGLHKVISPAIKDDRVSFMRGWEKSNYHTMGLDADWKQDNFSISKKGVLRGLHFQTHSHAQLKFVKILNGSVMDVVVDLRKDSDTYGQSYWTKLTAVGGEMLWIPRGFAHGFLALEDDTVMAYKCDNFYSAMASSGLVWDDASLNIPWEEWKTEYNIDQFIISEQDLNWEGINNIQAQVI